MGGRTSSPPERRRTMKRLFLSLILFLALAVSLSVFNVRALAGTSVTDVWAAGTLTSGAGFLIHFDGADWTSFDPKTTRPILSLALSPDDGSLWVGGGNGSILRGTLPSP